MRVTAGPRDTAGGEINIRKTRCSRRKSLLKWGQLLMSLATGVSVTAAGKKA